MWNLFLYCFDCALCRNSTFYFFLINFIPLFCASSFFRVCIDWKANWNILSQLYWTFFIIWFVIVHSSLGYKNAVKTVYERQLLEARTEAQQDPQYLLRGDVSSFVVIIYQFIQCPLSSCRFQKILCLLNKVYLYNYFRSSSLMRGMILVVQLSTQLIQHYPTGKLI